MISLILRVVACVLFVLAAVGIQPGRTLPTGLALWVASTVIPY